jgi:hypothetical protein
MRYLMHQQAMREEDLDWEVYHLIVADPSRDAGFLAAHLRCSPAEIQASLQRLERASLIEQGDGGRFRVLSIQEMILRCQARYCRDIPYVIEGGVIRLKKDREPDR